MPTPFARQSRIARDHAEARRRAWGPKFEPSTSEDTPLPEALLELPADQTVPSTRETREAFEEALRRPE